MADENEKMIEDDDLEEIVDALEEEFPLDQPITVQGTEYVLEEEERTEPEEQEEVDEEFGEALDDLEVDGSLEVEAMANEVAQEVVEDFDPEASLGDIDPKEVEELMEKYKSDLVEEAEEPKSVVIDVPVRAKVHNRRGLQREGMSIGARRGKGQKNKAKRDHEQQIFNREDSPDRNAATYKSGNAIFTQDDEK